MTCRSGRALAVVVDFCCEEARTGRPQCPLRARLDGIHDCPGAVDGWLAIKLGIGAALDA